MQLTKLLPILLLGGLLACQKPTDAISPSDTVVLDTLSATPTAVGQLLGAPTTKTIGPAGGTLATPDGKISLIFPAGAVKQETAFTVQAGENNAPNGIGQAFTISPNITFEQDVTVIYYYQDNEMDGAATDALGMAYQDGRKAWQLSQSVKVDKSKKTVTTKVKKAKWWALVTEYILTPEKDTVVVGESREMILKRLPNGGHFPDWSANDAKGDDSGILMPLTQPVTANNDVSKVYLNGVDWTSATPKDQSFGGVGYNPKTSQILYVAPSRKPKQNLALVTVEIKNPGSSATFLLSSQIMIIAENSLVINGHSFDNITANGSLVNNQLMVTAAGIDSTGKSGQISLYVNSLSIGAHPFANTIDDSQNTGLSVLDGAGKGDNIGGATFYSTCLAYKTESGAVQIVKVDRANGISKITLQVSGSVVTKHSFNPETCQVTEHKTMPVNGRFVVLARE